MTADASNAEATDSNASTPAPSNGGSGLAWFALLVAILALSAGGFSVWQTLQLQGLSSQASGSAGQRIDRLGGEVNARIDTLLRQSAEQQLAIGDVQLALEQTITSVADLPVRVDQVEAQIASVPGIDNKSRQAFLQSEAVYYMRIANAQAVLGGEPQIAANALQLADDKLREAANPKLTVVRQQLNADIAALRAVPVVDREGVSFKLQSLAAQVATWPFRYTAPNRFSSELPASQGGARDGAWQRVQGVAADVFDSIVSVREIDAPPESQLGSAEQAIIIESMRAELQLARLAVVGDNAELYRQAVTRVAEQTGRYFDVEASAVSAGLDTLAELGDVQLPGPLPDASGALTLMLERSAGPASDIQADESQPAETAP